ncbi:hypothetical protein DCCM_3816 [Desulfocucumis palustris]|uniref:Uncharacterized protein n=1 Tax=Desulfocucumis palustris TaxID=1898651 RepID=A0A2L2XK80_9FIRM|nr:hypothetical protein DCCM_3816 [Desulfocucumis palustris]
MQISGKPPACGLSLAYVKGINHTNMQKIYRSKLNPTRGETNL